MIDIYTAAVCANLYQGGAALPREVSSGVLRLTLGLCLLAGILGHLS